MNILRVGTDCSGIEAPIQALEQLGIQYKHVFSCDNNKHVIESIKANYNPETVYTDIYNRNNVEDIDLYVCGFPCQPFSSAGDRLGFEDSRGLIIHKCIELINKKRPKYFLLENVRGLLSHDKGNTFKCIMNELNKLDYNIQYKVLNTCDYGIPQSRNRLYIVGIKDKNIIFKWPKKTKLQNLNDYIDYTDNSKCITTSKQREYLKKIRRDSLFVDFSFINYNGYPNSNKICPCLLASGLLWNVKMDRKANVKELLKLQGFPETFKQVISDSKMKRQIGNSMSINVLKAIFNNLLIDLFI